MWVCVSVGLASGLIIRRGKNCNVGIFSYFAWCYYSLSFTSSCPWRPWPHFKVTGVSNSFNWKFYVLNLFSTNFIWLLSTSSRSWIYHLFWWSHIFQGDNGHIFSFGGKKINVGFFSDTIKTRSFKLCMIKTFLGVYIVILGLMILTLFQLIQDHKCVRNINCNLSVSDSCPL